LIVILEPLSPPGREEAADLGVRIGRTHQTLKGEFPKFIAGDAFAWTMKGGSRVVETINPEGKKRCQPRGEDGRGQVRDPVNVHVEGPFSAFLEGGGEKRRGKGAPTEEHYKKKISVDSPIKRGEGDKKKMRPRSDSPRRLERKEKEGQKDHFSTGGEQIL